MMVVVRMPPSPTGKLHLGTARTALFNWLFAKNKKGKIIFRWEDTDKDRSSVEFEKDILEGLRWLGMDFEQEADLFLRQSENELFHREQVRKLWDADKIFPCFVTEEEIDIQRKNAEEKKINFVFWSPYRNTPKSELQKKMDSGERFAWRLRCPRNYQISFDDLIRGQISVNSETLGDFVVARSDGSVLYLLANALDDFSQGVTHILRGEDHISNTPKQILLYEALGAEKPFFGHIPLVLDAQRKKLSKRNVPEGVCVLISDFREAGFVPEAVVNGLALTGWNPKTEQEIFSFEELVHAFDITKVNPGAAQYNFEKMKWFNAQWIKKLPVEKLISHYNFFAGTHFGVETSPAFLVAREKSRDLRELGEHLSYFFSLPEISLDLLLSEKLSIDLPVLQKLFPSLLEVLSNISDDFFSADILKEKMADLPASLGLSTGQVLNPFRVALSGKAVSVGPFEICGVLGKRESLKRVQNAFALVK